ncbi:MAG: tRNA pseudouridine(55) synthase TruB [Coprobacillaceae bacterium]
MNGIIIVNKPASYTSHDVVNVLRRILHTKKVGHCGTLDPDATGVLVVCVNKATKLVPYLTSDTKEYIGTLSLGSLTDTYDASGEVVESKEYKKIDEEIIKETILSFVGKQIQKPPIYSSIKVNGKKLYEYARSGEPVEIPTREVEILEMELLQIKDNLITFRALCSKGTYIRSLCVDIAKKLGYPGHMATLQRTKSGVFSIDKSYTLEQIENNEHTLFSIEEALQGYPKYIIEDDTVIYHGKQIPSKTQEEVVVYNKEGKALAIYGPAKEGYLKNIRGLW